MKKARPKRKPTTPKTRAPRIAVEGKVTVEIGLAGEIPETVGDVRNINHMGLYMWTDRALPEEAEVDFRITFPSQGEAIDGHGWVVFSNERSIAVQFDDWDRDTGKALDSLLKRCRPAAA
ncbi:MAG: hypothetical protein OEY97_03415 [Nitrospirota bacterium]|nr:hypothetical protein [Nitrospirota bacterium]